MTSGAPLCSDHVNYLIFRYLQEAGHENTATAFYRDWHRTPEYRDPENYPWAPVVRRNELVSIIQSGLHHDELEARVKKDSRKFQLTYVNSREGVERQHGAVFENGTAGSRPSSSSKRKGRPPSTVRPPDDFPTPASKRQRRSGSEGVHLNGDAMDVDAASPSADADEDGEAVSPAVASEPEMPERYDSMDVAVQTEVKTGPKTSTMYWKVDKPGATIYHSVFNPSSDPKNANTLLTVGESLCRFYQVPEDVNNAKQVQSIDEPPLPPNSVVTASAWHPNGTSAAFAVDGVRELSDGRQASRQLIFSHECDNRTSIHYQVPPLLDPQGIVLALRYSPDGSKLLILQTNIKRGMVLIYETSGSGETSNDAEKARLLAWRIFEHQVLDANWMGSHGFLVCGDNGLADACFLDPNAPPSPEENIGVGNITSQGLLKSTPLLPESELGRSYDRVRVSTSGAVAMVAPGADRKLIAAQHYVETNEVEFGAAMDLRDHVTAVAFQPEPDVDSTQPRFLATAFEEGRCVVYSYLHQKGEEIGSQELKELLTFYLTEGPALALAWSADGSYLAIAGTDLAQIWDMKALVRRDGHQLEIADAPHKPLVTWRPDSSALAPRNGEHEEPRTLSEPSLSWSADGESLAFAVDKQIAIIRFRPPLHQREEDGDANGHASP